MTSEHIVYECTVCERRGPTPDSIVHEPAVLHPDTPDTRRYRFPLPLDPGVGLFHRGVIEVPTALTEEQARDLKEKWVIGQSAPMRLLRKIVEASAAGASEPSFTEDGGIVLDSFVFVTEAEAKLIRQLWPNNGHEVAMDPSESSDS